MARMSGTRLSTPLHSFYTHIVLGERDCCIFAMSLTTTESHATSSFFKYGILWL